MCFVFISVQTVTSTSCYMNWLVLITEMKSVYCAVLKGSLNKTVCSLSLKISINLQHHWFLLFTNWKFYLYKKLKTPVGQMLSKNNKSTNCCIHTVVRPNYGSRNVWNLKRFTKYTKNKLCIMLVFLYTIISRWTVNKTLNARPHLLNICYRQPI